MPATKPLLIKNAFVVDPSQNLDGEVTDIAIMDGRIVESVLEGEADVIDAQRQLTVAGAIDIHANILNPMITHANLLSGSKEFSIPLVGTKYLQAGYTMFVEASVPTVSANLVHMNRALLPAMDVALLLDLGSSWLTTLDMHEGNYKRLGTLFCRYTNLCKAYGIAAFEPYETELWDEVLVPRDFPDPEKHVKHFEVSLSEALKGLVQGVRESGIPHPLHIRPHYAEFPGGSQAIRNFVEAALQESPDSDNNGYSLHWGTLAAYGVVESDGSPQLESEALAQFIDDHPDVEGDLGLYSFHKARVVGTRDKLARRFFDSSRPQFHQSLEMETEYVVGYRAIKKNRPLDVARWTAGLEIALQVKSLDRLQFTVNHPNYGTIDDVPRLLALLGSKKYRDQFMADFTSQLPTNASLPALDREYSLADLVQVTRVSPAHSLSLESKGTLRPGADADIVIYSFKPEEIDHTIDFIAFQNALTKAKVVIKGGKRVMEDGTLLLPDPGKVYWSSGAIPEADIQTLIPMKNKFYQKFFSLNWDTIRVPEEPYLERVG